MIAQRKKLLKRMTLIKNLKVMSLQKRIRKKLKMIVIAKKKTTKEEY
jgi:hypothetical protein